jgi:hypothetical protein
METGAGTWRSGRRRQDETGVDVVGVATMVTFLCWEKVPVGMVPETVTAHVPGTAMGRPSAVAS